MQKLLFICNDFIGNAMAGPGIRTWELAHALASKGHQTAILAKYFEKDFSRGSITFSGKASFITLFSWIRRSDCIVQPGRPLPILLSILFRKKMIFDQYDPVIFEFLERKPSTPFESLHKSLMLFLWKVRQRMILRFGHGFLVANEKQKDFLLGQLAILGYRKKMDSVTVLPFGLPHVKPVKKRPVLRGTKIKADDFLLVWGGGIWDWFDPTTLLHALAKIQSQRENIKVYFPGINPPSPDTRKLAVVDEFLSEARRLKLLDSTVFVNREWTPYEDRSDYLLEADAGISLHRDSMETRFAFRTRMLDYVWAGLPIISSTGDSWAEVIEKRELGITVRPGDVDAVSNAITKMADEKTFRSDCRSRVLTVAEEYQWDVLASQWKI